MRILKVFIGGLAGALLMSASMVVARFLGVAINLETLLGRWVPPIAAQDVWTSGLFLHLAMGGLLSLLYAALFEKATRRASASIGVVLGLAHAIFAGVILGVLPVFDPFVPLALEETRTFLFGLGLSGVLVFTGMHMLFGAFLGYVYPWCKARRAVPAFQAQPASS